MRGNTPGLSEITILKGDIMSSIANMVLGFVTLVVGNGKIGSDEQGFILIAFDRVCQVVTDVLKS